LEDSSRSQTLFGNDFGAETLFEWGCKQSLQSNLVPKLQFGNQQEIWRTNFMMSWLEVGDWAEDMSNKLHKQRLKVAAKHFGVYLGEILGDDQREKELLVRYEATGLPWPAIDEDDE
jgi:hypothetical protein